MGKLARAPSATQLVASQRPRPVAEIDGVEVSSGSPPRSCRGRLFDRSKISEIWRRLVLTSGQECPVVTEEIEFPSDLPRGGDTRAIRLRPTGVSGWIAPVRLGYAPRTRESVVNQGNVVAQ